MPTKQVGGPIPGVVRTWNNESKYCQLMFTRHVPCTRHCTECFPCINPLNPPTIQEMGGITLHLTDEDTEAWESQSLVHSYTACKQMS